MQTTADIGMRLIVPVESYATAGKVMDDIAEQVSHVLHAHELHTRSRFDFVHFNTRPCKAMQMDQIMHGGGPDVAEPMDGGF